jgi:rubrerythrin
MDKSNTLDILKMAILMEKKGHSFYSTVANNASDPGIRHVFMVMADEETKHVKILSEQYIAFEKGKSFKKVDLPDLSREDFATLILTEEMKQKISSAGFEAAAISAAIDFEKKSIEVYSKQAEASTDPNEKSLFNWLADWEKGHLRILSELDNELKERIWNDNQFWPF